MTETAALRAALVHERSVVFGLGVAGGRIGVDLVRSVRSADAAHRARSATVERLLADRGASVPPPPAWYDVATPVTDAASALRLLVDLEVSTTRVWRAVAEAAAAEDAAGLRDLAGAAMSDSAVRATTWRIAGLGPGVGAGAGAALGRTAPAWPGA